MMNQFLQQTGVAALVALGIIMVMIFVWAIISIHEIYTGVREIIDKLNAYVEKHRPTDEDVEE